MNSYITPRMLSSEKQKELLDKFPNCSNKELSVLYNIKESTIMAFAAKRGVYKSEAWKNSTNCGKFRKGAVPVNKGVKMTADKYNKCKATMFKKGNKPHNINSIGHKRVSKDGYVYVKTGESKLNSNYELLHRVVWQKYNGDIPKGYNVQFKDGNRQNCDIDNLYLISRAEQLRNENSLHARLPKEIAELIQIKGAINRQINKQLKAQTENE
jgi:hypothetical protein